MRRMLALLALLALTTTACGGDGSPGDPVTTPDPTGAEASFTEAAADAVRDVRAGDAVLLDVRTDEEFAAGHAEGSRHLPLARIEEGERPDVAKDATLYVLCRTGRRSAEAVEILRADGFTDVTNIGGLTHWEDAGGPVER